MCAGGFYAPSSERHDSVADDSQTQDSRLLLFDPAALNHVLVAHAYEYPKPEEVRGDLAMILGKGILFAEGAPRFLRLLRRDRANPYPR